jgi:CO dehydrogenase/acetyl-CoA synthase delta subunit
VTLRDEIPRPAVEEDAATADLIDAIDAVVHLIDGPGNGSKYIDAVVILQRAAAAEVERIMRDYIEIAPRFAPPGR